MTDTILVYTTVEEKEEALTISRILLEKRLIACSQIESPVDSLYWWNGKIEQAKEYRLLMKTRQSLWEDLVFEIKKYHSYDVPEIVAIPVSAISDDYKKWLQEALNNE